MKDAIKLLWEEVEDDALCLERRVETLDMEVPPDAKDAEELFEELKQRFLGESESVDLQKNKNL